MKKIRVFYSDSQSVDDRTLFSPSVRKPRLVMVDWYNKQAFPVKVLNFDPVTAKDLHRVHEKRYVNGVLDQASERVRVAFKSDCSKSALDFGFDGGCDTGCHEDWWCGCQSHERFPSCRILWWWWLLHVQRAHAGCS